MSTHQHENEINYSQDNIFPLEHNSTIAGPEYCTISETQERDLKVAFMSIIEVLTKELNEFLKQSYKNTNSVWIRIKQFKT